VCDLDDNVNLDSRFLRGMLSDTQVSTSGSVTPPVATTEPVNVGTRDREPTEDDWENV